MVCNLIQVYFTYLSKFSHHHNTLTPLATHTYAYITPHTHSHIFIHTYSQHPRTHMKYTHTHVVTIIPSNAALHTRHSKLTQTHTHIPYTHLIKVSTPSKRHTHTQNHHVPLAAHCIRGIRPTTPHTTYSVPGAPPRTWPLT